MPRYEPDPSYVDTVLDALSIFRVASEDLARAQSMPLDDEYVGRIWLAMEKKAKAEARLWEAYGD